MLNLQLIQNQPRWRIAVVAKLAQLMGVMVHFEGIPFGSNRSRYDQARSSMGGETAQGTGGETKNEADEAYGYLTRLFQAVAPQCTPLPTLLGVCTQIDNYIAGLRADIKSQS